MPLFACGQKVALTTADGQLVWIVFTCLRRNNSEYQHVTIGFILYQKGNHCTLDLLTIVTIKHHFSLTDEKQEEPVVFALLTLVICLFPHFSLSQSE